MPKRPRSRSPGGSGSGEEDSGGWQVLEDRSVLALVPVAEVTPVLLRQAKERGSVRIAAFDLDDTLIKSKTGKTFPVGRDDWTWVHPHVPTHLRELWARGYAVCVFSNQSGITTKGWDDAKAADLRAKLLAVRAALELPLACYVSTRSDRFRKPLPSLWTLMIETLQGPARALAAADWRTQSFYVGDAAGRPGPTLAGRKKDFSCSDRKFAYNVGVGFFTPEDFFLPPLPPADRPVTAPPAPPASSFSWGGVGPDTLRSMPTSYAGLTVPRTTASGADTVTLPSTPPLLARPGTQELVILCGYPGCGKSSVYRRHFEPFGYVHVNQDTLKTKPRCVSAATAALAQGSSVVVDSTNPTAADRQPFVAAARRVPVPVRVLYLHYTLEVANHMNLLRGRLGLGAMVPIIAYYSFRKKFEPFTAASVKKEGLESVLELPPVADFSGLPDSVAEEFLLLS